MISSAKQYGYELSKIEVWNFGTYNSYQKIPLSNLSPGSFADLRSHVMLTGKNGSGKSTLMDLIWIALLPDERLLRLGVVETASPEGKKSIKGVRSTADYVLGKYLSGDEAGGSGQKTLSPYLRQEGASAILLTLSHRETAQSISIGRKWWYSNHLLKNENAFFVCRGEFSIRDGKYNLMNPKGEPYENARMFTRGIKSTYDSLVDATMKGAEYTRTLGEIFGGISNDDVILLMKAANAKAIDNVNHFVRDFILSPPKEQALDALIDRIKETSFLAKKIRDTTEMFQLSKLIVDDFSKAEANFEALHLEKVRAALVDVYELKAREEEKTSDKQQKEISLEQCAALISQLEPQIHKLDDEEKSAAARVNSSNTAFKLREIESQISQKTVELEKQQKDLKDAKVVAQKTGIDLPEDAGGLENLLKQVSNRSEQLSLEITELDQKNMESFMVSRELGNQFGVRTQELEYLERHKTTFPSDLYEIKLNMMRDLRIDEKDIMFVGELFMIPPENREFERAIKATFSGIAHRLVVHPQYESEADAWLNKYKNKRRVGLQNLKSYSFVKRAFSPPANGSILSKIKFRDPSESAFYYAIKEWLQDDFDVKVVEIGEFSSSSQMVVTKEGFVKLSGKYRVKHGDRIDAPIGWDPTEKKEELRREIEKLRIDKNAVDSAIQKHKSAIEELRFQKELLGSLSKSGFEFLGIADTKKRLSEMEDQKIALLEGDSDFKKDQELWYSLRQRHLDAIAQKSGQEQVAKLLRSEISDLDESIAKDSKAMLSLLEDKVSRSLSLREIYREDELTLNLEKIRNEIIESGLTIQKFKQEVGSKIQNYSNKGHMASLIRRLQSYQSAYHDANLQYELNVSDEEALYQQARGWREHLQYLEGTELPNCHEDWNKVYSTKLWEAIRDFIDNHKKGIEKIKEDIEVLNMGIRQMKFEKSFLELHFEDARLDVRIKDFNQLLKGLESIFSARFKALDTKTQVEEIDRVLLPFARFMEEGGKRDFSTDPRNHFVFSIKSIKKNDDGEVESMETFKGSSQDAKSGGQTVQLCYVLLAMALAQRFHFNDPVRGQNTPRFIVLDEFADKLDNEKPEGIVKLFGDMGFQAVLLTPYSKVDLLRPMMNKVISVIKNPDTQHSKATEIDIDNLTHDQKTEMSEGDAEEAGS